ncbi:two-component sensor histidine kinase [Microlunatus endophyticus]|uniref:histidine kinase n=1 Tax=Microlunatus endophyticus TaxID=1716077 RepID=A0A917SA71_9ACTN|nr:two-component sensor histidine kinase [Microlunatus endophyticus]
MVSAVLVVGAALLAGGGLLLVLLQSALINTTQVSLDERARDVALLVQQSGLDRTDLEVTADLEHGERIQLLTPNGTVVQSSDTRLTVPMAPGLLPATGQSISRRVPEIPALDSDDDVLVVGYGFSAHGRNLIVQIGRPVQIQADTIRTVGWFLLGGGPLLLGVVAIATWVLVGRSLRTVDRITTQVSRIGGRSLDERIEVPRTADEIEHLARTMNSMLDRLQASDRAQKAFVSDASHELRSPLSTLMVTSEIASKDPTGKTWLEMGDLIDSEVSRMQSLVDDLLTLAKVDANGLMLRREEVDLDDLLQNEIRRLRAASRVRVRARIQPVRAVGDPDRLAQVIRNVVDNARLHSRGQVAITLTAEDGLARILIDNDGLVIPEADRQRIFERFVRLDDDRSRDSGGSGLGLAISSAIMAAHDGRISAAETDQGWCRFVIELPISTDQIKIDDQDDDDHPEVDHEPVDHEPGDQARPTPEPANRDGRSSPDWSGVRR